MKTEDRQVSAEDLEASLAPTEEEVSELLAGQVATWPAWLLDEYADGGLTDAQRAIIEQALASDPLLQKRYAKRRTAQVQKDADFLTRLTAGPESCTSSVPSPSGTRPIGESTHPPSGTQLAGTIAEELTVLGQPAPAASQPLARKPHKQKR